MLDLDSTLIVFGLVVAAQAGGQLVSTRYLSKGQDRLEEGQDAMNEHLTTLNGTTEKHAGQLRRLRKEIGSLPCREGGDKWTVDDCDAVMDDED